MAMSSPVTVTNVLMDVSKPRGQKLDPEMQDEIKALGPGLEEGEVTEETIALQAVTREKVQLGAIDSPQMAAGAVTEPNVGPLSINSAAIKDDALLGRHAGPGIVSAVDAAGNYIESKDCYLTMAEYSQIVNPDPNITYHVKMP